MKYVHTNLISKDWKALAGFYIQVFDCKMILPQRDLSGDWLDKATNVQNAHLKGAHLRLPGYGKKGPTLELFQYDEQEEQASPIPNRQGFGHIAFEVDDVQAILDKALQFGGQAFGTVTRKEVASVGTLTFVYIKDPEGNIIELQNWDRVIEMVPDSGIDSSQKPLEQSKEPSNQSAPKDLTTSTENEEDVPRDKRSYLNELYNDLDDAKRLVDDAKSEIKQTKTAALEEKQRALKGKKIASLEDIVETTDTIKTKGQLLEELKQEMNLSDKKLVIGKTDEKPSSTEKEEQAPTIDLNPKDKPAKLKVELKIDGKVKTLDLRSVKLSQKAPELAVTLRALVSIKPSEDALTLLESIGEQYKADLVPLLKHAQSDNSKDEQNWAFVPRFIGSLEHLLGKCDDSPNILEEAGLEQIQLSPELFIAAYQDLQTIILEAQEQQASYVRLYYSK